MGIWRRHSRDFKLQVVRQIINGEKSRAQICREHDLAERVVSRWKEEYLERGEAAFAPKAVSHDQQLEARIAQLERFCGQLAAENDALKKTLAKQRLQGGTK
jgi:transposase-like protein